MTAVYAYRTDVSPPAPFAAVSTGHPEESSRVENVPAQIDYGAYKTVIPKQIADAMKLEPLRLVPTGGLAGNIAVLPTYLVKLTIVGTVNPYLLEVLASEDEPYVLVGRDILNQLYVILDGPNLTMKIG